MSHNRTRQTTGSGLLVSLVLLAIVGTIVYFSSAASAPTFPDISSPVQAAAIAALETPDAINAEETAAATPTLMPSPTATGTPSPTIMPTATPLPMPTLNLADCTLAGCGEQAEPLPTVEYDYNLLLTFEQPQRRSCPDCPANDYFSAADLDALVEADADTLAQLRQIALSQRPYQLGPGVFYVVSDYVHHVVIDLDEPGHTLRNIIPPIPDPETQADIRITPSYCFRPESLVVTTADYHGLVGSNKTETGRELFFHLGRAALFRQNDGRYDLDVLREYEDFQQTEVSWGAGPIFMWDGQYDFDPEQEWFEPKNLEYYSSNPWAKLTVALSKDRKYLFLTASYGLTLEEHANNIIELGRRWGIELDRAMRFDSTESTYMAIRLGDYMVPILNLEEPLIVNCFAVEERSPTAPGQ